jgi:hypothetical protein
MVHPAPPFLSEGFGKGLPEKIRLSMGIANSFQYFLLGIFVCSQSGYHS